MAVVNLETLEPTQISKDLKGKFILFYGAPKSGKTTILSKFPKHLICAFEPGTNALQGAMVAPMDKWSDFKSIISQLKRPNMQEKFDTIGIDTGDKAWTMCEKHICQTNGVSQIGEIPYGKGYDLCEKEFSDAFETLARLGYGLCFVSHSSEKTMKDEKGDEYISLAPALSKRPYGIINKMVDIIGFIRQKKDPETGLEMQKIYFRGNDNFVAGSRYKYIEPIVDFEYTAVTNAILTAIDKQIAESGGSYTNEKNVFYQEDNSLNFNDLMTEARELWSKIVGSDTQKATEVLEVVKQIFGKEMKISQVSPDQVDLLNVLVLELRQKV